MRDRGLPPRQRARAIRASRRPVGADERRRPGGSSWSAFIAPAGAALATARSIGDDSVRYPPMEMRSVATFRTGRSGSTNPSGTAFAAWRSATASEVALQSKAGQPLGRYFPEIVRRAGAAARGDGSCSTASWSSRSPARSRSTRCSSASIPAASRVAMLAKKTPAWYLVFDLLAEDGTDWSSCRSRERRARLEELARAVRRRDAAALAGDARPRGGRRLVRARRRRARRRDREARRRGVCERQPRCRREGQAHAHGRLRDRRLPLCEGIDDARSARCCSDSTTKTGCSTTSGSAARSPPTEKRALLERLRPHVGEPGFTGGAPDMAPSRWSRGAERDRSYVKLKHELVLEVAFDQVTVRPHPPRNAAAALAHRQSAAAVHRPSSSPRPTARSRCWTSSTWSATRRPAPSA